MNIQSLEIGSDVIPATMGPSNQFDTVAPAESTLPVAPRGNFYILFQANNLKSYYS